MDPETIDPLINALPPAWLEVLQTYAPHVIAWGGLVLLLVHILLPLARKLEARAIATPDPRDDGPTRRIREALEAIAGVSRFVLSWIPRFTIGDPEPPPARRRRAETMRPPPSDGGALAIGLLILAAALSVATSACSSGPQTVPQTTPINISCSWAEGACPRIIDGGVSPSASNGSTASDDQPGSSTGSITVGGCDCYVDRATSGAEATTTGNEIRDNTISPRVDTSVSAIPGVGQ